MPSWARAPGSIAEDLAAAFCGNYQATDPLRVWLQRGQRVTLCLGWLVVTVVSTLDGSIDGPVLVAFQFTIWCLLAWIVISVGVRAQDPERVALLHATLSRHNSQVTPVGTFLRGCVKFLFTMSFEV